MEKETSISEKEFTITREFNAPKELVFNVFTKAEHLEKWWGPKGSEINVKTFDLRPGGKFHYSMKYQEGPEMYGVFVYHEITPHDRIVFSSGFADETGNFIRAPFANTFPLEIKNTWTLTEKNGKTTLTLTGGPVKASSEERAFYEGMFPSMQQGFAGTFDQLENYLSTL
ncbi:MAG TPA: SRPBCC domain-containing protein [Flavobacteriales bacterium]|nr:SRPBCC domain-containing protein [Flavobacteriales bacterium]